ncbi:hypothetical protein [Nonomuraea rhizosphaerae]|uniref:hypothetical protein n=1 Tax=Nonomuraea rhizosphaerae TaxID=2665663 RepID=UPI001C6030C9|nr:hypothetical protein [Nonomuraea rhizosphaerae]
MLAFSLGLAWLLLAPLALWVLVRGHNLARVGAVLTLALLELATIAMNRVTARHDEQRGPAVVAHDVPQPSGCVTRMPVPETARLSGARDGLTLSWPAVPGECDTAKVVLRAEGRKLRVWVHEGPLHGHHGGAETVPIRVVGGSATLRVPLDPPARKRSRAVDGRTGHRIPSAANAGGQLRERERTASRTPADSFANAGR